MELPVKLPLLDELEVLAFGVETVVLPVPTPALNPVPVELVELGELVELADWFDGTVLLLADEFWDDVGTAGLVLQPVSRVESKPTLTTVR